MNDKDADTVGKDLFAKAAVIDVKQLLEDTMTLMRELQGLDETEMTRMRFNDALVGAFVVTSIEAGVDEETTMNYVREIFRAVAGVAEVRRG